VSRNIFFTSTVNLLTFYEEVWDYKPLFENIMNNEVRETLNITANVTWKFVGDDVYKSLKPDVIKSITHKGEQDPTLFQLK
jgi:hypothetical protein